MARCQTNRNPTHPTRRDFMRAAGCAAIAGTSIVSTIRAAVRDDLSSTSLQPRSSYRAAVCIFLYGGNDANNLIVPTDSRYRDYAAARTNLALPHASLLPLNVLDSAGKTYGLHPACSRLGQLFNTGQLAILANVGTLVSPISKAQFQASAVDVPSGLFSHTEQQAQWESLVANHSTTADSQQTDSRPNNWVTPFQNNNLCRQLSRIASQIASRAADNRTHDTFFVSLGGYDLHAAQTTDGDPTTGAHANLLTELSEGMYAFQKAMEQLGLADNVVTFTMSEFGRTLTSNGLGSDHGWGSHHLIMGGKNLIHGQKIHGTFPGLNLNGPDDVGAGRWLPTTSVDQYAATIARWLGTSASDLSLHFTNTGRFSISDLGFMKLGK